MALSELSLTSSKRRRSLQSNDADADDSTELKLAILASLHPDVTQDVLMEALLAHRGDTNEASNALLDASESANIAADPVIKPRVIGNEALPKQSERKQTPANGYQSSLNAFVTTIESSDHTSLNQRGSKKRCVIQKGKTLHLYSPADIETNTPCTIVHNFLSPADADALLLELLDDIPNFRRGTFQLFDRTVQSPHTWRFYVDSPEQVEDQQTHYTFESLYELNVTETLPHMRRISDLVRSKVNEIVTRRMRERFPSGKKLQFQSPDEWQPNASFVNCYDGPAESVGYHADQLTYLGPHAIIGSLSLGVAREFRVRRIQPPGSDDGDSAGQIAIHLPHNSLLVMHADMQEEWKHCVAPARAIDPHPIAGSKRLNITYRCYRSYLHPRLIPRCDCKQAAVLRCSQQRATSRGRYMWMCYANYTPGQKGCAFFQWAEFDENGKPPWAEGYLGNRNEPRALAEG